MLVSHHIKIWHYFHSKLFCFLYCFLAIFIHSSTKFYFFPIYLLVSCNCIGDDRAITMTNMRNSIGVINRCCYKKFVFFFHFLFSK